MSFYTNVCVHKNNIYIRGIENSKPFKRVIEYKPYLFIKNKENSKYKTIDNQNVKRIDFDSIYDAKEFIKKYKEVEGIPIYGLTDFQYTYLYDKYYNCSYEKELISIVSLDIEVGKNDSGGYSSAEEASGPITAITISKNKILYTFALKDFDNKFDDVKYYKCLNEKELLLKFLSVWNELSPDVITGWNIEFFDIPYLVNRITKILSEDVAKRLSPWGLIKPYESMIQGRVQKSYNLIGISNLDYMGLYKKFILKPRESYSLDFISSVELDEKKIDYSEYGSLFELYEKNFQLYIEYNIHDVRLIDKLEEKLKLIEMVFAIAYDAGINYEDSLTTVLLWDVIIHNYLMEQNIVVPPKKLSMKSGIEGGYVKEPLIGMSKWVVSFDLTSLYPHLIMQYAIGPETFHGKMDFDVDTFFKIVENGFLNCEDEKLISTQTFEAIKYAHDNNLSLTANGCMYKKDKRGFLGDLMYKMFKERKMYKDLMLENKKEYEKTKNKDLKNLISKYDNLQQTRKVNLNGAYGALLNLYFRWFDTNNGESITLSGQLSIKWIEKCLNKYLNKICKTTDVDYVIAVDTDSTYLSFDKIVQMIMPDEKDESKIVKFIEKISIQKIQPYIQKCYEDLAKYMNAYEQCMHMKLEAISNKGIWTAKKRYILNMFYNEGVEYKTPELKMMGIEAIRSSTPGIVRKAFKECFNIIMNKKEEDLQEYISNFFDRFKQKTFQEVAFPRSVSNIEEYNKNKNVIYDKGSPIHVKGSLIYNHYLKNKKMNEYPKIMSGDKIKFSYLKVPNELGSEVISCPNEIPKELKLEQFIDYEKQFEVSFLRPLRTITGVIGWELEKRSTLDGFF